MEFPHVDEGTEERFARLWPLVSQNQELKAAAKDAPDMLKFSREGGEPHFRLYESRIPASVDADATFGGFATEEARQASIAEGAAFRATKQTVDRAQGETLDKAYPVESRYYPAMADGNRERFNQAIKDAGLNPRSDVPYVTKVGAFVSKSGPIPALAEWQTPEAQAMWKAEEGRLREQAGKGVSRAEEATRATALRVDGKSFQADTMKGLVLPATKFPEQRAAVLKAIGEASIEDLKGALERTEREHTALKRKQYGIQIRAAQERDPKLTTEAFNALNDSELRVAANYNELSKEDFARKIGLQYGAKSLTDELKARGEHISVEEAREKKERAGVGSDKKGVDEKKKALKQDPEPEKAAEKPKGRAGNRGAAQAQALAATLGRG